MDNVTKEPTTAQAVYEAMLQYAADDEERALQMPTVHLAVSGFYRGRAEGYRLAADMLVTRGLVS